MSKMRHGRGWIADKLMDLRKESGMTLEQVAKESGISISTLSNYENGNSEPNAYVLEDILAVYQCTLGDFLDVVPTDYGTALKVFQAYGLGEDFLRELEMQRLFSKRGLSYDMAGILNLISKYPLEAQSFYKALENFFDYHNHEQLSYKITQGTTERGVRLPGQTVARMLIEPVVCALIDIFHTEYADKLTSAIGEWSKEQAVISQEFRADVVNIMRGKWKKELKE